MLVAAATAALIAGAGGAFAQAEKKMDPQSGAQSQSGAETQKKNGVQTQTQDKRQDGAQTQAPGSQAPRGQAEDKDTKQQPRGQAQDKNMKDQPRGQAQDKDMKTSPGQAQQDAQGGKAVQLDEQQRTRISQTIKQKNVNLRTVERSKVSFQLNVGAVVPRTIELYPLPAPIVQIVPAYRSYLYIVVGDQLLIIHPQTYEIVAVIPA